MPFSTSFPLHMNQCHLSIRLLAQIALLLILTSSVLAQNVTISGYVTDASSGEALIGATVFDMRSSKGVVANSFGFYSLTLPRDSVDLRVSFIGYKTSRLNQMLRSNEVINFALSGQVEIAEVEIVGERTESEISSPQMSRVDISLDKVKALPVFLGERDVLKTIQLMPGVQSGSEGASGLYVRGGGPDQNLILLDGVPIYNASHLFGFFSIFNTDALNSVELIKGGFPAEYGGRLSSVIDMRMKEGHAKELKGEGGIGLVASRLTLEGPILKDRMSFMVSARRTYIDFLARPLIRNAGDGADGGYYFYDLNGKVNYRFSERSRLFVSGYFGRDRFFAKDTYRYNQDEPVEETFRADLGWGNAIAAVRWNYIFGPRLFSNTTLTYSQYDFEVGSSFEQRGTGSGSSFYERQGISYGSGIRDWGAKIDFNYYPAPDHRVKFGTAYTYHNFIPGVSRISVFADVLSNDIVLGSSEIFANELSMYVQDDWSVTDRLRINGGLHLGSFFVRQESYLSLQPRFSASYLINELTALKASYANMAQFLHLLSNAGIGLPTDLWVPPTDRIRPQFADQVAAGIVRTLPKGYQISLEGYYKWMRNLIEYKDGASFVSSASNWEDLVATGTGTSYGAELLFEKKLGKTSGWIGYTLAWANRQFEELNFGREFPYRYDRRHDVSFALTHVFNDRVDIGVVWVYGTGNAVSLPIERYQRLPEINGNNFFQQDIGHIESRNNYRMAAYHRLDLGVNLHRKTRWGERTWNIGVYNAYSRQNPFFLYFSFDEFGNQRLTQFSLFPIIPSVTYNFKF